MLIHNACKFPRSLRPALFLLLGIDVNIFLPVVFRLSKSLFKCVYNVIYSSYCYIRLLSIRQRGFYCLIHEKLPLGATTIPFIPYDYISIGSFLPYIANAFCRLNKEGVTAMENSH